MEIEFFSLSLSERIVLAPFEILFLAISGYFRFIGLRSRSFQQIFSCSIIAFFFLFIGDLGNFFGNLILVLYLEKVARLRYELSMITS